MGATVRDCLKRPPASFLLNRDSAVSAQADGAPSTASDRQPHSLHTEYRPVCIESAESWQYERILNRANAAATGVPMADVLRFARRSVAKALQKTVSGTGMEGLLDEIPNCFPLTHMSRLSIKLQEEQLHQAVVKKHILSGHFDFPPINFLIRDEQSEKRTVMTATLICSRGFLVKANDKDVMEVAIPNKSTGSLGKIAHPTGVTIFKVIVAGTGKFRVQKVSSQNSGGAYMSIEKEAKPIYQLANMSGLLFEDGVYWLKRADGRVLGKVRPKFVLHQNTIILQFEDSSADGQQRAVMLGVALLLVLSHAYPELTSVLKDSMNAEF